MAIKVNLLRNSGFIHGGSDMVKNRPALVKSAKQQNQQFEKFEIQNGYGTATKVSVSPGYGAKVVANIDIEVNSVSEETFNEIINEVKKSISYKTNSKFQEDVDSYSYSSAGSSSSGIFGWLVGKSSSSYDNNHSNLTKSINNYESGDASSDTKVANSVANIMVKSSSKVKVTSRVEVTGQLLTPSPTVIAVESTVFSFTDAEGNSSSVTMLNQTPLVPVNANNGTVSGNTLAPGSKLVIKPIGG